MKKVLVFILSCTLFLSVFLMGTTVQGDMVETAPQSYEYFENVQVSKIAFGVDRFSGALTEDGRLFMWGYNGAGQLGDGTTISKYIPLEITQNFGLAFREEIVEVDFGEQFSIALTSNARVFTWGDNDYYTLGNGSTVSESLPFDITANFGLEEYDEIIDIQAGLYHSAALSSNGEVFTWGTNESGLLGDGTDTDQWLPVNITDNLGLIGYEYVQKLSLGGTHTMALTSEGRVLVWGENGDGQLGNNTTVSSFIPIDITSQFTLSETDRIIEIVAGSYSSLALTYEGRVFTWGYNGGAELGDGTYVDKIVPNEITSGFGFAFNEHVVQVVHGDGNYFLLTNNDRLFGWGYNYYDQMGVGNTNTQASPVDMTAFLGLEATEDVLDIAACFGTIGVITTSNKLFVWGYNDEGQVGDGTTIDRDLPFDIISQFNRVLILETSLLFNETIIDVELGDFHYAVVTSEGRLFMWGYNSDGQLGDGTITDSDIPIDVTDSLNLALDEKVIDVECGSEHTVILTDNGTVYAWGNNEHGQLGDNSTTTSYTPIELPTTAFNDEAVVFISTYGDTVGVITADDTVYTWGNNNTGQMGDGTSVSKSIPTDVTGNFVLAVDETIVDIEFGLYFSAAISSEGKLFTWGYNSAGQLGTGTTSIISTLLPAELPASNFGGDTIVDVSAGYSHMAVATSTGMIYTWGANYTGQLGTGNTANSSIPVALPLSDFANETIVSVSCGYGFTTAITSSGALYTWGDNNSGQMATGDRSYTYSPTMVSTFVDPVDIIQVSGGEDNVIALSQDFEVYIWGSTRIGPIGSQDILYHRVPEKLFDKTSIEYIYAPLVHEYYSESIPISVFPTYNISDQIYSITINQIEYLSTELTISDGRIDLLIDNEGIINEFFTIQVDAITFIAGNPVDASENNVVKTMLFDLEAPTFSPLFIEEIDVGLVDIDWTTRIINLDDNSGLPVTLEELEDYVMYDTLGTYQVTLRATDATGNETLNTFDVIVSDLTSPVVTINGGAMTLQLGDTYIELGATYTDNYDEPGDAVISGDTVDTSTLGVYNVSYTYTDTSGNQSVEMSRTVTVIDTTAPVITLTGGDTIYIEVGESYTELGAMYTDNDGTAGDAIVSGDTVDTDTVGNYVVEYDIEDTNGNSAATVSRTIIVQDTVDPVVSGVTDNEVYEKGSEVTITFNEGTALLNGQAFTSGTTVSEPGEYTLVVSDGSGNVTTTTFTIEEGSNVLAIVLVIVGLMAIGAGVYIVKKFIFDK